MSYDEMKRHLPVLRGVIKYLTGRDLLTARLIDPFWEDAIVDTLQRQESIGKSPLKPIVLRDFQALQRFEAAFPQGNPEMRMTLLHFANVKFWLMTREIQQFSDVYGSFITSVTIGIPAYSDDVMNLLKMLLNKYPVLQKLCLNQADPDAEAGNVDSEAGNADSKADDPDPKADDTQLESPRLGTLDSLVRIELDVIPDQSLGIGRFLEEVVNSSPRLQWTSIRLGEFIPTPEIMTALPTIFKPLDRTVILELELAIILFEDGQATGFKELGELNLKIEKLILAFFQFSPQFTSDEDMNSITDWLGKLIWLEKLTLLVPPYERSEGGRVRFPPMLNIRSLELLEGKLDTAFEPFQVPNLEKVRIPRLANSKNPFALGKVFPGVKSLTLLGYEDPNSDWKFSFPNLEYLKFDRLDVNRSADVTRKLLAQFPTLVSLIANFQVPDRDPWQDIEEVNDAAAVDWWDLFTGGIRPYMNHETNLDIILAKPPLSTTEEQEGNETRPLSLFELLPNLKRFEITRDVPEMLIYAIIHLTAIEKMPRLEFLRFDHNLAAEINNFIPMLKAYHRCVVVVFNLPPSQQ